MLLYKSLLSTEAVSDCGASEASAASTSKVVVEAAPKEKLGQCIWSSSHHRHEKLTDELRRYVLTWPQFK